MWTCALAFPRWEARELEWPDISGSLLSGRGSRALVVEVDSGRPGQWLPERTGALALPREPQGWLMPVPNA